MDTEQAPETAEEETETEDPDGGLSITPPEYAWFASGADEQRRCFVFECMANAEIDGNILVKNMEAIAEWIKNGGAPVVESPRKAGIKAVK